MANYAVLKAAIQNAVDWDNNNKEISGQDMLGILNTMINSLGAGYMFAGVAKLTPTQTDPGTPDQNVFYIASEPGTYTNFPTTGGYLQVAENEVAIFKYNGQWSKETTGAATASVVGQLLVNSPVEIVAFDTNRQTTRLNVPLSHRKHGMILLYYDGTNWNIDQFVREPQEETLINYLWGTSDYWATFSIRADITSMNTALRNIFGSDFSEIADAITWTDNYYIDKDGNTVSSNGHSYSSPFAVKKGDILFVRMDGGNLPAACSLVNEVSGDAPYTYAPLGFYRDRQYGSYIYVAEKDATISVCIARSVQYQPSVKHYRSVLFVGVLDGVLANKDNIVAIQTYQDKVKQVLDCGQESPVTTEEAGSFYVRFDTGGTTSSSGYRTTKPIYFEAGTCLKIIAFAGGSAALVSKTDDFGLGQFYQPRVQHSNTPDYYYIHESGYYVFSYRYQDGFSATQISKSSVSVNGRNIFAKDNPPTIVKSVSHQGTPFSGDNLMSRFFHSCLQGFDYMLCNLSFTSDNVPVLNHDNQYTNQDNQVITISDYTYAQIATMPVKNKGGEILGKFDDFVKMCKLMGRKIVVMGFTHYFTPTQQQAAFDIVAKYQMRDNTIWGIDTGEVANVMAWYSRSAMMIQDSASGNLATLLQNIQDYSAYKNGKNKIILWLSGASGVWNVDDIATANQALPEDMEIGMYFIGDNTNRYLDFLPYITYYTHDYYTIQDKRDLVIQAARQLVKFD